MTVIYSESRFPRASRDDCTRASSPLQGPFYNVERAGHRAVLLASIVGLVGVVLALLIGWL